MALKSKQYSIKHGRGLKRQSSLQGFKTLWRFAGNFWRLFLNGLLKLSPKARVIIVPILILVFCIFFNWGYHTFNKPSELLFPLDQSLNKLPVETWKHYKSLFQEHATSVITPEFLAALAQVEGAGNPVARTYWRWQLTGNPLEWYRPASSAVGMFQITDSTFKEAKRYCIHHHLVVEDGPWYDWESCWFNSLYTRVVPSHAIEMTAALLDRQVTQTLKSQQLTRITRQKKQDLAAVIHLCGAGAGRAYAARGLRLKRNQRCGDHDLRHYLQRIHSLQQGFVKPATRSKTLQQAP